MTTLSTVREFWSWTGLDAAEIVAMNPFGNLLIRDTAGQIWRLCPEDLYCRVVAPNDEALQALLKDPEFIEDWEMRALVHAAHEKLGPLESGRRYCLKLPGAIGGAYDAENMATLHIEELIGFSGHLANQITDLPEGTQINLKVVD